MARKNRRSKSSKVGKYVKEMNRRFRGYTTQNVNPTSKSPPLLSIERKTFYFKRLDDGRNFRISEEGKLYAEIVLELGIVRWCRDALLALVIHRGQGGFFRKWRGPNALFLLQAFSNAGGNFCILSKEPFKGRRSRLFIPEGRNGQGWKDFANSLGCFVPGSLNRGAGQVVNPRKVANQAQTSIPVRMGNLGKAKKWTVIEEKIVEAAKEEIVEDFEPEFRLNLAFDIKKTVIVRRKRADDDWWHIRQALEENFKVMVNLRPCCGNLAIGHCATQQEAIIVCNQENITIGGFDLEVLWWDPSSFLDKQRMVFSEGWVEILGIPPQLRTEEIIGRIAGLCGGLVEDEIIKGLWGLHENIFVKVKGCEDGFIPIGSLITEGGVCFPLRFIRCSSLLESDAISENSINLSCEEEIKEDKQGFECEKAEKVSNKSLLLERGISERVVVSNKSKVEETMENCIIDRTVLDESNEMFEEDLLGKDSLPVKENEDELMAQGNLKDYLDDSSHLSSDSETERVSFESTPEPSFQSYEDLQLLQDASPPCTGIVEDSLFVDGSKASHNPSVQEGFLGVESLRSRSSVRRSKSLSSGDSFDMEKRRVAENYEEQNDLEEDLPICLDFLNTKAEGLANTDSDYINHLFGVNIEGGSEKELMSLDFLGPKLNSITPFLSNSSGFIGAGTSNHTYCPFYSNPVWSFNPFQVPLPCFSPEVDCVTSPSFPKITDRVGCSLVLSTPDLVLSASKQAGCEHQVERSYILDPSPCALDFALNKENNNCFSQEKATVLSGGLNEDGKEVWNRVSILAKKMDVTVFSTDVEPVVSSDSRKIEEIHFSDTPKGSSVKGMREVKGLFSSVNYENRRPRNVGRGVKSYKC